MPYENFAPIRGEIDVEVHGLRHHVSFGILSPEAASAFSISAAWALWMGILRLCLTVIDYCRSDGIDTNDMFCLAVANFGSSRNYRLTCSRRRCTCLSNFVPIGCC